MNFFTYIYLTLEEIGCSRAAHAMINEGYPKEAARLLVERERISKLKKRLKTKNTKTLATSS